MGAWLSVFAANLALDLVWVIYTRALVQHRAFAASIYATGIVTLSGFSAVSFVENHWLLVPAASGAFLGTFVMVWTPLRTLFDRVRDRLRVEQ